MNAHRIVKSLTAAVAVAALAAGAYTLGTTGVGTADYDQHLTIAEPVAAAKPAVERKATKPAPRTAKGYARMFASLDSAEWGAADGSISVRLADGRRVWVYADTLSGNNGFVHSSAIVQTGGTLHVSNGGAQVLPNDKARGGRQTIYWPELVRVARDGSLLITAAPVSIPVAGGDLWDFERHATESRVAKVRVSAEGDLTFVKWVRTIERPNLTTDGEDLEILGPNHYAYQKVTHDIRLADGSWLRTVCQNWDDGLDNHRNADGSLRYEDFRPMFESTTVAP